MICLYGTKAGGLRAASTNKAKHGEDFYKNIGRKGGSKSTPDGGFGSKKVGKDGLTGRERAKLAGHKGGRISRRNGKKVDIDDGEMSVEEYEKIYGGK